MPKVYCVNWMEHDFSDAKRFSSEPLVYVTEGPVPFNSHTVYTMAQKLRDFSADDYLLISGSAVLAAMAVAILKETNDIEHINLLIYRPRERKYQPERLSGYVEFHD